MLEEELKIFVDQLKGGEEEDLTLLAPATILGVAEEELSFADPIEISGKAYTTSNDLVIYLQCKTKAEIPCAICNEKTMISLDTGMECHTFELKDLSANSFDYTDLVREEILMRVPQFVECKPDACPARSVLKNYVKASGKREKSSSTVEYPFANLN